jgi:hypothetical protein
LLDGLPRRCGAAVKNLSHSASFHSRENNAPSNPGIKHLEGGWQSCSFLVQRNRDKLSTRKFDVGVFTQPGPKSEIGV